MRTTDWCYDFSSLPRWKNRENLKDIYDEYHELPKSNALCCLYSISEVGMMDYRGFLAILRNKQKPELVLNITKDYNFTPFFFASAEEDLIFLQPCMDRTLRPILILDLRKNCFTCVANVTCTVRQVVQHSATVFSIEMHDRHKSGKKIRTRWLKWRPFDQLPFLRCFL